MTMNGPALLRPPAQDAAADRYSVALPAWPGSVAVSDRSVDFHVDARALPAGSATDRYAPPRGEAFTARFSAAFLASVPAVKAR
jgi:hypothetical protein